MDEGAAIQTMPQSLEAEQSVVGAMITDSNAIMSAMEILSRKDFYFDHVEDL